MDSAAATNVVLVRHGQTNWNAEMRLQGHMDPELNEQGRQQAAELAAALREEPFDAVYSSDLKRALQTAEAIVAGRPSVVQIHTSIALRERALGVLEGLTMREAAVRQSDACRLLRGQDEDTALPGGGESVNAMRRRVVAEIDRICSEHPGRTVLVVAHGGVLHAVYRHAVGRVYGGAIANASLHRLRVQGGVWVLVEWNVRLVMALLGTIACERGHYVRDVDLLAPTKRAVSALGAAEVRAGGGSSAGGFAAGASSSDAGGDQPNGVSSNDAGGDQPNGASSSDAGEAAPDRIAIRLKAGKLRLYLLSVEQSAWTADLSADLARRY
ncbi:phosphoglycerate mutase [Volvox carteri f. nagariensis]|uniref:Phosphoglycerate mutase n=1 Tax=Volvox carteri f. nagariensis TaxID=3068 RepID=D8UL08_VOLCA|nr:phosphoglycerate mutase [Volvox carteri f. nagariensis]EFJ39591.1 phosphoglycerate mutase [Volvox carteri f. nagariensis]|eukprot:XP_002959341.1 phosphoglycerate mutase [Volvox carteri f. nagariensis]